MPRAWMG